MKNKLNKYWKVFIEILNKREMSILPAHLAYYLMLSTIPAFTLIFFIAYKLNIPSDAITNFISSIFSPNVTNSLLNIVGTTSINIKNIFLFLVAFYATSSGARSIITASNTVFNIYESSFLKRMIKSFTITIIIIILITFILLVPLFGSSIINLLTRIFRSNELLTIVDLIFPVLKWPVTLLTLFIFIKLLYTIAPDEKIPSSYVNKGTIFTTISWALITEVYSFYIKNIASYDKLYGALSIVIILLFWYWLLSYAFVIGLVLNYRNTELEIEKTNTIKLTEINKKIKEMSNKK